MKTLALILIAAVSAPAFAADYSVADGSKLGFSGSFQGASFDGEFTRFNATISYDPANLAASKFDVTVEPDSVSSGDGDRDGTLPGKDFFNTKAFPTAHFVSTGFRQSGSEVIADGTLTIKGTTKPVSLKVTFAAAGSGATLGVTTTLNRLDYKIGEGEYADTGTIGAEVKVKADLKLVAK